MLNEEKIKNNLPESVKAFEFRANREFTRFFDLKRIVTNSGDFIQVKKLGLRKIMKLFTGDESPKAHNAGGDANMTLDLFLHFRNYLEFNFNSSLERFHNKLWYSGFK